MTAELIAIIHNRFSADGEKMVEIQCPHCKQLPMIFADNGWSAIACPDCKSHLNYPKKGENNNDGI
tara:strand:+ start:1189 stop:1386 length:198 start_codon:yes stop_codon:yes gene_type:complete